MIKTIRENYFFKFWLDYCFYTMNTKMQSNVLNLGTFSSRLNLIIEF